VNLLEVYEMKVNRMSDVFGGKVPGLNSPISFSDVSKSKTHKEPVDLSSPEQSAWDNMGKQGSLDLFGDYDMDKTPNIFDCDPFDKTKQDKAAEMTGLKTTTMKAKLLKRNKGFGAWADDVKTSESGKMTYAERNLDPAVMRTMTADQLYGSRKLSTSNPMVTMVPEKEGWLNRTGTAFGNFRRGLKGQTVSEEAAERQAREQVREVVQIGKAQIKAEDILKSYADELKTGREKTKKDKTEKDWKDEARRMGYTVPEYENPYIRQSLGAVSSGLPTSGYGVQPYGGQQLSMMGAQMQQPRDRTDEILGFGQGWNVGNTQAVDMIKLGNQQRSFGSVVGESIGPQMQTEPYDVKVDEAIGSGDVAREWRKRQAVPTATPVPPAAPMMQEPMQPQQVVMQEPVQQQMQMQQPMMEDRQAMQPQGAVPQMDARCSNQPDRPFWSELSGRCVSFPRGMYKKTKKLADKYSRYAMQEKR
jgi:hypothetical protein